MHQYSTEPKQTVKTLSLSEADEKCNKPSANVTEMRFGAPNDVAPTINHSCTFSYVGYVEGTARKTEDWQNG